LKLKEDVIFWVTVRNEKKLVTLSNMSINQGNCKILGLEFNK